VGTPVIDRIYVAVAVEHGNRPIASQYHLHSNALEISEGAYVDPIFNLSLQSHDLVPLVKRDKIPVIIY
jgi:hypothetical protein